MSNAVCPVWMGRLLSLSVRKLFQDPEEMLGPHVRPGMWVLDVGCAMGYFSLPMARMVGEDGRVVCVDFQAGMIAGLARKVQEERLYATMDIRICTAHTLCLGDLKAHIDFAFAMAVVHEVPDPERLFAEVREALRPGGRFLVAEPSGHVGAAAFEATAALARTAGFHEIGRPRAPICRAVLLGKEEQAAVR